MNEVEKLNKHTIYYYCDNKIKYYINVPHKDYDITNISLEFLEDTSQYDPEINDIEWIKNNIIEYYKKVDDDNITLVLPLLTEEEKSNLLTLNVNKLNLIEKLMALYINSSYITLIKNKVNVHREVFLIENDRFINFIKYFKQLHNSRIVVKRLIEINTSNDKEEEYIKNENNTNEIKPFSINENFLDEILNNEIKEEPKPINNIINISDLGNLSTNGLNGSIPGNVTINIENLVTENKESNKTTEKNEEKDDEVSELDEDISDIDEFDDSEDFDLDAIDVSEAVLSNDDVNKTYRTVTSGGVKFVVGRKDDENLKPIEINKNNSIDLNENQNLKIDMPTNIVKGDDQINKNAGFASYFTLFFVAISAIFIIIYIIIK